MGLQAHVIDTGAWGGLFQTGITDLAQLPSWSAVLQIIFVNMLLSGDNAVVIAMACRPLPRRQRLWGLLIGAGLAVILLIVFAEVIIRLLELPYLKLAGGIALIYIAAKLLVPEHPDKTEVEAVAHLWRAVRIIVVADIVMSFDNMLAVVEIARGNLTLLAIGLAVSIPMIFGGAALITALLDRLPILIWVGSALLGWVGGDTAVSDRAIADALSRIIDHEYSAQVEWAAAACGALLVVVAGGFWRYRRLSKDRAEDRA